LSCLFGSNFARIMLWGCRWFLHYIPQLRCTIWQGTFPFSMPSRKPLQLVAVKDVGLAAGVSLKNVSSLSDYSLAFLKHSPWMGRGRVADPCCWIPLWKKHGKISGLVCKLYAAKRVWWIQPRACWGRTHPITNVWGIFPSSRWLESEPFQAPKILVLVHQQASRTSLFYLFL
jgi:hypothetical protein